MTKYTEAQRRLLDTARDNFGDRPFTPTQIGVLLGYAEVFAASRVASTLRIFVADGVLLKNKTGHNKATYRIVKP